MPILIAILVGAAIAIVLVRSGLVTARILVATMYSVLGAIIGFMVLRYIIGPLGPVGAGIGAVAGAVVLLFLAQRFSSRGD